MALSQKEIKARGFAKKKAAASRVPCACGCGVEILNVDDYGRPKRFISGHNTLRKYPDKYGYKKAWIKRNRAWINTRRQRISRERKVALIRLAGGRCVECGLLYDGKNGPAFHFHHKGIRKKLFNLSSQLTGRPFAVLKREARKCALMCANCHFIHHGGEY